MASRLQNRTAATIAKPNTSHAVASAVFGLKP